MTLPILLFTLNKNETFHIACCTTFVALPDDIRGELLDIRCTPPKRINEYLMLKTKALQQQVLQSVVGWSAALRPTRIAHP